MLTNSIKRLIFVLLLVLTIYISFLVMPYLLRIIIFLIKIIIPFLLSFAVAFVLQPIVLFVQNKVKRRSLAVFIVLFAFLGIIVLVGYLVFPYLIKELKVLIVSLPDILNQFELLCNRFAQKLDFLPENYKPTFDNLNAFLGKYIGNLSSVPGKIVDRFLSYVSYLVVIPMTIIYFLLDYEKLLCSFREYLIKKNRIHFKNYLAELNSIMSSYIRGTFLVMIILISVCTPIFLLLKLDFALFFAIIIAVTNIIPYLGPYIGGAFPVLYALIDSPTKALTIAIVVYTIQQIESNFLTPYINSRRIKTHPLIVIFVVILFGKLFGIVGMIFAVPVLAIIKITLKYYNPFIRKKTV